MSFVVPAYAQCPVCVVTVGGGMLIAKKLGVDDLLMALWISALNTAISFWLAPKFKLKLLKNSYVFSFLMFVFTLVYFQFTDQISPTNQVLGISKIIVGLVFGMLIMFLANNFYAFIKKKNGNKTPFPYAKVVFPLLFILILSFLFKLIFRL